MHKWVSGTILLVLIGGCVQLIGGCVQSPEDAVSASYREQFLVAAEPDNPLTLTEVADQLKSVDEAEVSPSLVVVGRIYAGELEPWEANKASFILSELPAEGHGEGHDADNCPFCKRRAAKAPTAIVRFLDDQDQTIGIDARKLFNLESGQTVVVRGSVERGAFDSLVLNAEQIHIR